MNETLKLSFLESDAPHLPISNYYVRQSEISIYELALELEERYSVLKKFVDKYYNQIIAIITRELMYNGLTNSSESESKKVIANAIKNLYLDYMEGGEHGIVSKRALATGTVGLIDTGQYYNNMNVAIDDITATGEF